MDPPGFEPGAFALQGQRSPNWATGPYLEELSPLFNESKIDDLVFDCYISNIIFV